MTNKTSKEIKKTILVDLDGVLNTYDGNFDPKYIPPIRNGAYDFIKNLSRNFKIEIFTSRNLLLASQWVLENGLDEFIENVTNIKNPAYLIIDDRCICFKGNYEVLNEKIFEFKSLCNTF